MKRVTAFVGSARKRNTYRAALQFLDNLQALGGVEYEIAVLGDYRLEPCRGCRLCFKKGEQFCPLKDDRDVLFDKIGASDGVVFATPNYTWDMSGIMKVFLDRFGFAVHRPRHFGKAFTSIVDQAFGGGEKIVDYFGYTAGVLGFNTLKGVTVTGFDPRTEEQQRKIARDLAKHSRRFHTLLTKPAYPVPTLFQLLVFKVSRSMIKQKADPGSVDYGYYADKGWLESDYYYPTHLSPPKKVAGRLFDSKAVISMAVTVRNMMA
jgi:multimeric flavodoxin WrbA